MKDHQTGQVTHRLKIAPRWYEAVKLGAKRAELRRDDRPGGFMIGDTLILEEWDVQTQKHSGRELHVLVVHILRAVEGLMPGYAILSIEILKEGLWPGN